MSIAGRSLLALFVSTFLISCHSSTDSQTRKVLEETVKNFSKVQAVSKQLTIPPPSQGKLSMEHMEMYAWVSARSVQFFLQQHNSSTVKTTPMVTGTVTDGLVKTALDVEPAKKDSASTISQDLKYNVSISSGEVAAINELGLSREVYAWVKTTYHLTVDFIDTAGKSGVIELVTFYDPVLKHNIDLVNEFKTKLESAIILNQYHKPLAHLNANFGPEPIARSYFATG